MLFWEGSVGKADWAYQFKYYGKTTITWYGSAIQIHGQNGVITNVT